MKVAASFFVVSRFHYHFKRFRFWRPDAKMRFVFADDLRTYRVTALHTGVFSSQLSAMAVRDLASPSGAMRFKFV